LGAGNGRAGNWRSRCRDVFTMRWDCGPRTLHLSVLYTFLRDPLPFALRPRAPTLVGGVPVGADSEPETSEYA